MFDTSQLRLDSTKQMSLTEVVLMGGLEINKILYILLILWMTLWLYYSLICFTRSSWAVHLSNPPSYSLMQYSVGGFAVCTYLGLVLRYNWIGMLSIQCYWEAIKNSHSISEMRHCFATLHSPFYTSRQRPENIIATEKFLELMNKT